MSNTQSETPEFCLIHGRRVGMENSRGAFLYDPSVGWIPDTEHVIKNHLYGYDPSEPDDSPYKMFNESIMDEMEKISADEARNRVEPEHWDATK